MSRLPPIILPPDWDEQKDCEYFEERCMPKTSYSAALWEWMRYHHGVMVKVLDAALLCYRRRDATLVPVELQCLTPAEKIEILAEFAASSTLVEAYRTDLVEALKDLAHSEAERMRVIREYRRAGDHAWTYPVIEVIDYLGEAAFGLDLFLSSHCKDYQSPKDDFVWGSD